MSEHRTTDAYHGRDFITNAGDEFAGFGIAAGVLMKWDPSAQTHYPAGPAPHVIRTVGYGMQDIRVRVDGSAWITDDDGRDYLQIAEPGTVDAHTPEGTLQYLADEASEDALRREEDRARKCKRGADATRYEIRLSLVLKGDGAERATEEIASYVERDVAEQFGEHAPGGYAGPVATLVRAKPLTHSGFRNFETFCVANYVSGNYDGEAMYRGFRALASLHADDRELAKACRELVERRAPIGTGSVFADLLAGALEDVDWETIARYVRAE